MSMFYINKNNLFVVKNQKTLKISLAIIFTGLGIFSLLTNENSQRGIISFFILLVIAGFMLASLRVRMVFDLNKSIFYVQNGSNKPKFIQPLSNYSGLELIRQYRFFGLMRNSILNVVFNDNNKVIKMPIRQFGPGSKAPQVMIEETEKFLQVNSRRN
ncbi:hypothetical protein RJ490_005435 [Pluralibacter gergoviae]|uniref:hypothetical protein n=1 Tax=Pluralibacter gergoviae TaxID=61647 RepID=UPI00065D39F6|nr:hypothetical protein [Pluralibacter gergoviae]EKV0933170.1 hypothetical protein [Pluralibacter gergoviae]EKW9969566.1 hypothetical protein [Pluralibacter gergoviae]ELD4274466.1 hypothetical protein [Pluralibacter gergoviae]ELD4280083.1 hypothetical protein [Pluralibacter gergoviae]ELD4303869.1 hypothetical protein [Pluralibacter gergoviae]